MQARGILNLKNEDKEESLPVANSYSSHHPRYTKTKEHPKKIQQSMGAEMMTKADRDKKYPTMGDCSLHRVMVVMTNMVRGKIASHMIDLTWRPYLSSMHRL